MWVELVEIIEQRCLNDKLPRQRRARAAILLYGGLINCEEAFTRYKHTQSEVDLANAVLAIDSFISTLYNLDSLLSLFEPELKAKLGKYALEESRMAYLSKPKELLKTQVELLRNIVNAEVEVMPLITHNLSAFTGTRERLARFITDTFSPNEIFEGS
ncbi:hypothetical protein Nhal_2144 [Nitrosococcus halophilus Nc 4]|uniref:Uncharacterized protein n=1 Tax=Nitrosococcus halophilus (strain Nc4) TaxID=472759 RepID=D5C520_NITHN|nr:hypothetical protein [Nitrosococcus halophilus]ADE15243.1 hypothetical protein Nhal_2144 [Nitrosococcus halophilus Nc 4]